MDLILAYFWRAATCSIPNSWCRIYSIWKLISIEPSIIIMLGISCTMLLSVFVPKRDFPVGSAAAAAAKSLQSCPTLCNPIDGSPPGSSIPVILQARTLEWVAISFSNVWKEKWKWSCSVVSDSSRPHGLQPTGLLPPSMGFSRQEAWSGVPLPSPILI